mmetsp:Transcript_26922/g.40740  ORF Transcript_26922/g.40740 Transcript_26922/m.40740 type:complete len:380 (-) Transcript_26922:1620-2759(-)
MNCVVAYEMYDLVKKSYRREKTKPPALRKVYIQGACIYMISIVLATWYALEVPWSPYSVSKKGVAVWASMKGGVFTTAGTVMLSIAILGPPSIYVLCIALTIWLKKLLPTSGRTRVISLYFIRILLVFFAFYYPNIALYILKSLVKNPNIFFLMQLSNRVFEFAQALLTLHLARKKADVDRAVKELRSEIVETFKQCLRKPFPKPLRQKDQSIAVVNSDNKIPLEGAQVEVQPPISDESGSDKWKQEDIYADPLRKPASTLGSQVENVVWKGIDQEKVEGKNVKKTSLEEKKKSLYSKLSPDGFTFGDFESSAEVSLNRSSKASIINNRSEVTMDSYDSDFRRLNDDLKRLDIEADEIIDYLQGSKAETQENDDEEISA